MERSESVQAFLNRLTGQDNQAAIRDDQCVGCGAPAKDFRDAESEREYAMSGLCQKCQDAVFNEDDEEAPAY
jgi:hypothetical protein